jgi:hypothetical protein
MLVPLAVIAVAAYWCPTGGAVPARPLIGRLRYDRPGSSPLHRLMCSTSNLPRF